MGKQPDKITKSFAKVISKNFRSCRILLFGSRARGTSKKTSDYDFLLVSPEFKKWDWEERSAKVYFLKRNIPASMDIVCYTPEEFEHKKKQLGIVQQAIKEGIEIKAA